MATFTQLPMIACSNCGKCIGHLYDTYYALTKRLEPYHSKLLNGESKLSDITFPDREDIMNIVNNFLMPYYEESSKKLTEDESTIIKYDDGTIVSGSEDLDESILYTEKAVVARALLSHRLKWKVDRDFPFSKAAKDEMSRVRYCCIRMFLCDNSEAPY